MTIIVASSGSTGNRTTSRPKAAVAGGAFRRADGDGSWRDHAACRDADPELFVPHSEPDSAAYTRTTDLAKAHCRVCPVRLDCLAYAAATYVNGVWGGLDDNDRRAIGHRVPR